MPEMLLARTASSRRPRPRWPALAIAVAVVAALAVAGLAGTRDAGAASTPACYGAAARDPQHPCYNPKLRLRVEPTPDEAELIPNFPCRPVEQDGFFGVCSFGLPQDQAPNGPIALVGDSHAIHWRAAVDVVARAHGWQGLSVTASSCLFSKAE